ncbi:unnamed protein product, partial [Linum tenue]
EKKLNQTFPSSNTAAAIPFDSGKRTALVSLNRLEVNDLGKILEGRRILGGAGVNPPVGGEEEELRR